MPSFQVYLLLSFGAMVPARAAQLERRGAGARSGCRPLVSPSLAPWALHLSCQCAGPFLSVKNEQNIFGGGNNFSAKSPSLWEAGFSDRSRENDREHKNRRIRSVVITGRRAGLVSRSNNQRLMAPMARPT